MMHNCREHIAELPDSLEAQLMSGYHHDPTEILPACSKKRIAPVVENSGFNLLYTSNASGLKSSLFGGIFQAPIM